MSRILKANYLGEFNLFYQEDQQSEIKVLILPPTIKSQSLLALLIYQRDHSHNRDQLMEMFWGDSPSKKARRSLSTSLWHIRRCFPEHDPIEGYSKSIQFSFDGDIQLDTDLFNKTISLGTNSDLQNEITNHQGEFLDGFYDDWVVNERYRIQSIFIEMLEKLMVHQEEIGDHNNAIHSAQRLVELDPMREEAHRLLMRVFYALGQRNAALSQYRLCQKILKNELDVDPMPETNILFQDIKTGRHIIREISSTIVIPPTVRVTSMVRSPLDVVERHLFVGRNEELTFLEEQWADAWKGQGKMVLLGGDAGIGKTHLLKNFARGLSAKGVRALWGRCYEFERLLPYQPIIEALQPSLTKLSLEDKTQLPEWVYLELSRLLLDIPGVQSGHSQSPSHSGDQDQTRLFAGLSHFLSLLSSSAPILIVLEDLHWATDSTLELLHYLVRNVIAQDRVAQSSNPILLVGSFRPEENPNQLKTFQRRLQRDQRAIPLELAPLSTEAVVQLVFDMSGGDEAITPLAQKLHQESAGNPFFLVETLKALFEIEAITLTEGTWQGDFNHISQGKLPLPSSISEIILGRIHRMSETTQEALRIAAVLGREFDFDLLAAAFPRDEEVSLDALDEMLRRRVIEEGKQSSDRDYVFSHHKIQEVVYENIPRPRRQRIHAQIGMAMENHHDHEQDEFVNELAHHYLQAQQLDQSLTGKAIQYLHQAGDLAAKHFANGDAVAYYTQALKLVPDFDHSKRHKILLARERIYDFQGDRESQKFDLEALWTLVEGMATEQQAEVMLRKARFSRETGDYQAALEMAQIAINLAKTDQQAMISEGYMVMAQALNRMGKSLAAQSKYKQGLKLARATGEAWLEAFCLNGLGLTFLYLGNPNEARRHMVEAVQIYRQAEDPRGLSAALTNLGVISNEQGDNIAAVSFYKDALEIHKRMGNRKGEGMVLGNLGVIASARGEYMQARKDQLQVLAIARETKNQLIEGNALLNLGNVYLSIGVSKEAIENYQLALDVYRQIGNQPGLGWGLAYTSLHAHHLGNHTSALAYAQEALKIAEEISDSHIQGYALTHLGHALHSLGRSSEADKCYKKAVDLRRDLGEIHLVMESLSGMLRVGLNRNRLAAATSHLEEILTFLDNAPLEGMDELFRVYLSCYQVLRANNDPRAHQILITAHTLLQEQAINIKDETLRRSFLENVSAHQELVIAFAQSKSSI